MKYQPSLRLRLILAAGIAICFVLTIVFFFLEYLFERHVTRKSEAELGVYVQQIMSSLSFDQEGRSYLNVPLADPRFERPYSGYYWQINRGNTVILTSRSLWDQSLVVQSATRSFAGNNIEPLSGPDEQPLISLARQVFVKEKDNSSPYTIVAAMNEKEIAIFLESFDNDLKVAMFVLGAVLLLAAWQQISVGLRPLERVRQDINTIRTNAKPSLDGNYPEEIQLLVEEINGLLGGKEEALSIARARAADLAHGLKTPIAILAAESRNLHKKGESASAEEIDQQIDTMNRHVERQLTVARTRGRGGNFAKKINLHNSMARLIGTMKQLPNGDRISWKLDIPENIYVDFDRHDFENVFGNILDNARKWSHQAVEINAISNSDTTEIVVRDDGPGVPQEKIETILQRGSRLDESIQGSGFGLSITGDILDVYGYQLNISTENARGLELK
ncbi:MAG: ATP-binding protein, partial [Methyloligellaceae bacterium]